MNDTPQTIESSGKPTFFGILGVMVLMVGIGAVIYYMTPRGGQTVGTNSYSTSTEQVPDVPKVNPPAFLTSTTTSQPSQNLMHTITIETSKGTIVFETYDADAPKATANFISLAEQGYYNGVIFHRVIEKFMIQGGDPTGTGRGGPGYTFEDELNPATQSYKNGYKRGVVAMANAGPNTNGSQFFIMHQDVDLPPAYSIFGHVVKGMEVVDAIATTPRDEDDRPLTPITMTKVTVEEKK